MKITPKRQAALDLQGLTLASITACVVSITANTVDRNELLTAEQAAEASRLYNEMLALQQWIVFGEKPSKPKR